MKCTTKIPSGNSSPHRHYSSFPPTKAVGTTEQSPHSKLQKDLLSLKSSAPPFSTFIADKPKIARRFLQCRDSFRFANKPILVKVGFHYTNTKNIKSIRTYGLRKGTRAYFGTGTYISENPHAFSTYGDTGIVVLYIPGSEQNLGKSDKSDKHANVDSFRGNKLARSRSKEYYFKAAKTTYFDEIIVQRHHQILPVFAYPRASVNNADQLYLFHKQIQELVDRTINYVEDYNTGASLVPRKTAVPRIFPSYDDLRYEHKVYGRQKGQYEEENRMVFFHDGTVVEQWR